MEEQIAFDTLMFIAIVVIPPVCFLLGVEVGRRIGVNTMRAMNDTLARELDALQSRAKGDPP